MASVSSSSPRARFDWEAALAQDADLLRIDEAVQQTIARLTGQPPARADAGRGSRFEAPPVKAEAEAPQFINVRDYQSESSSDVDTREVNPMDELSDFEPGTPQREQDTQEQDQDGQQDVEMQVQGQHRTGCEVCGSSERERDIVLCDDCDAEFHVFCLRPPLAAVPEGQWLCPKCSAKDPQMAEQVKTETEATETAETTESAQVATGDTTAEDNATSIPIAQALEGDPEKSNLLLIHACNCDDVKCTDHEFRVFCPHMKRFLRSVCWASHSDKWRSYRLARITAELFAYHAMNCQLEQCNVPLCVKIREEEIV